MGVEGIISKRRDCPYRSGRGTDWLKAKCTHRQELGIAGYLPRSDNARAVGALVLAYYEDGTLTDAGRVGTGFTPRSRRLYGSRCRRCAATRRSSPKNLGRATGCSGRHLSRAFARTRILRRSGARTSTGDENRGQGTAEKIPQRISLPSEGKTAAAFAVTHSDTIRVLGRAATCVPDSAPTPSFPCP
jgi:hypothetical protein